MKCFPQIFLYCSHGTKVGYIRRSKLLPLDMIRRCLGKFNLIGFPKGDS